VKAAIEKMITDTSKIKGVLAITSPYSEEGAQQIAGQGPQAGKVAFANVQLRDGLAQGDFIKIASNVEKMKPKLAGLTTELGGEVFAEFEPPESEVIGIAFAIACRSESHSPASASAPPW
jgi:putative drug exporter of the RND superfamily